jgi:hypothetical protein
MSDRQGELILCQRERESNHRYEDRGSSLKDGLDRGSIPKDSSVRGSNPKRKIPFSINVKWG